MTPLPVPTLDHVVVNTRDQLDTAEAQFRRLGFTLTPRGYHTLGSMNHLAIFGTDYLELIAARPDDPRRPDITDAPVGLNGLVFGTEDSASVFRALSEAGVPVEPPLEFSRPVQLAPGSPDGSRDATFRTVRLKPGVVAAGRLYFCHHFTRDLVWRDEWRHHANGVIGIERAVIAADAPGDVTAVLERMFSPAALRSLAEGGSLRMGLSAIDVVTPAALARGWADAAPGQAGRSQFMAALVLRTRSLSAVRTALAAGGITPRELPVGLVVPADEAFGVALSFRE